MSTASKQSGSQKGCEPQRYLLSTFIRIRRYTHISVYCCISAAVRILCIYPLQSSARPFLPFCLLLELFSLSGGRKILTQLCCHRLTTRCFIVSLVCLCCAYDMSVCVWSNSLHSPCAPSARLVVMCAHN